MFTRLSFSIEMVFILKLHAWLWKVTLASALLVYLPIWCSMDDSDMLFLLFPSCNYTPPFASLP